MDRHPIGLHGLESARTTERSEIRAHSLLRETHATPKRRQVDFEIWSRAHNFFKFETLTPIKAKGYVDPVRVFRPLGQALKDDDSQVSDLAVVLASKTHNHLMPNRTYTSITCTVC